MNKSEIKEFIYAQEKLLRSPFHPAAVADDEESDVEWTTTLPPDILDLVIASGPSSSHLRK